MVIRSDIEPWRGSRRSIVPSILGSTMDLSSPFRDFDNVFRDAWRTLSPLQTLSQVGPACDVRETDKHYIMSFDVPGMSKEDINVEVSGNCLCVSGERKEERSEGDEGSRSFFSERHYGSFERSLTLPNDVDPSRVSAEYHNGVLEVSIPKSEESHRSKVAISERNGGEKREIQASASEKSSNKKR
jgi:HSP20 family protein